MPSKFEFSVVLWKKASAFKTNESVVIRGRLIWVSPNIGHGGTIQKLVAFNVMCQDSEHSHALGRSLGCTRTLT